MKIGVHPRPGESWGRAVQRAIGEVLSAAGYEVALLPEGGEGGDLVIDRTLLEVRSTRIDRGNQPVFDVDKGLVTHHRQADLWNLDRIVVVFAWIDTEKREAEVLAESGEIFERQARANAREYMAQPGPRIEQRRRPLYPMSASDMSPFEEFFPEVGGVLV